MKRLPLFAFLFSVLLLLPAVAQTAPPHFAANSKVFIEPMNGFETYLTAAIIKKQVPITVVDAKEKADYIITGTSNVKEAGWAKTIFVSPGAAAQASITVKTPAGDLVYAYSVDKFSSARRDQSTAEACAKHMKQEINKKR